MKLAFGVGIIALALSACSQAPGTAGSSNACINPTDISKQTIVSDTEIRFELRNGDTWVNTLPRTCPGLKFQQGFEWVVRGNLVCSNQQSIRVLKEGSTCQLGAFTKAAKAAP